MPTTNIVIIPARGGSKGIPGKNICSVGGKPLLAWSIDQARLTPQISRVFVSTDSIGIAEVAQEYGAEVIMRPPEISGDSATSESCLVHALDVLRSAERRAQSAEGKEQSGKSQEPGALPAFPFASDLRPPTSDLRLPVSDLRPLTLENCEPDLVVFLQATSPLREPDDIKKAIETLAREDADSLFSACRVEGFVWRVEKDGTPRSFTYDHLNRPRRQDAPEDLIENGSIYMFKPWVLRQFNNRLGGKVAVYRMPALHSFQIDEPADLELVEAVMEFRRKRAEIRGQRSEEGGQRSEDGSQTSDVSSRWSAIRLLVLDFDGVLTDNRVLVTEDGKEAVMCWRGDGLGLERLRAQGVDVIVISKEKNPVVAARCRKLGIVFIQGCDEKLASLLALTALRNLSSADVAYVGNDVNDMECMRWVGLPIAVADAVPEVLAVAKWVTTKPGGHGAVREVCDRLLRAV